MALAAALAVLPEALAVASAAGGLPGKALAVGCVNCGAFHYNADFASPDAFRAEWARLASDWNCDVFFYEDVGEGTPGNVASGTLDIRAEAGPAPRSVDVVTLPGSLDVDGKPRLTRRHRALRLVYSLDDGRTLALYGVHLVAESHIGTSTNGSPEGLSLSGRLRQKQFEALLRDAVGFDLAILAGDFNAQGVEEYRAFLDRGFAVANGSPRFGAHATLRGIPADNIILSPGLSFIDFHVLEDYLLDTDHKPLVSRVRLAPNPGR